MYRGRGKLITGILAIFAVFMLAAVSPAVSDDSSASMDSTDLKVVYDDDQVITMSASSTKEFTFYVHNMLSENRVLYVTAETGNSSVTVNTSSAPMQILANEDKLITLEITADKYAHQDNYTITLRQTA